MRHDASEQHPDYAMQGMKMGGCKLKAMCHLSSVKGAGKYGSVSEGVHTKNLKKKKVLLQEKFLPSSLTFWSF